MKVRLTAIVSLRFLNRIVPRPASSRVMPAMAFMLTMVEDVAYFKAEDKYTAVMTAEGEALIRKPIRELMDVLDPATFKQVHRATIVNLKAIAGITRDEAGRGTIRLRNRKETIAVSLTFMPLFRNM